MIRPGFASRATSTTFRQFPQRDEAVMADIEGMGAPGWSNGNREPEAEPVEESVAEAKVVSPAATEDKAVKKSTARKSTTRRN